MISGSGEEQGLLIMVFCQEWRYLVLAPDTTGGLKTPVRLPRPACETLRGADVRVARKLDLKDQSR